MVANSFGILSERVLMHTSIKSVNYKHFSLSARCQQSAGKITQRQKLQRAVKEYGSTMIIFHVTISLASLGFFYLLVSR